jgi:hypothetical protein
MATSTIEARCNARPTRLAFVLPNANTDMLISVFARATSLWGGMFNPIIILDDAGRRVRGRHIELSAERPYLELQENLLMAFDPDLLCNFGGEPLPKELSAFQHRTFTADRLDRPLMNERKVSHFVDVWPIYDELWEKEFKSSITPAVKIGFIDKTASEASAFLAARFGLYASDGAYAYLTKRFNAETLQYEEHLKATVRPRNLMMPLAITAIHCRQNRQFFHSHAYFLLDPEDPFDLVDYWNLRAAGMILMPLTLADYRDREAPIRDFAALAGYPINEEVRNQVLLIKAWSVTDDEAAGVREWLSSLEGMAGIMTQGWVPRYSTSRYSDHDEIEIEPIMGFESSAISVLNNGYGVLQGQAPSFLRQDHFHSYWSMDLSFYTSWEENTCYRLPWLNEGCDALVQRTIGGGFDMEAARVSKSGLVTQHFGSRGDTRLSAVTAIEAVKAFLWGKEIRYIRTSSPGLALMRIVEMLGSIRDCELFQNSAIRSILEDLASGGSKPSAVVRAELNKSLQGLNEHGKPATKDQIGKRIDLLLDQAVEAKVFRIGLVFQCSRCKRHNWYAVTEFDEHYNCKSCFARELTPRLDSTKWHYASDGFFRSTNKLDGNITVLLALNFFNHMFEGHVFFAPSFDYSFAGNENEMDFALLSDGARQSPVEMIFGESKSGNALTQDEREKLKSFGIKTSSYLCFCTMADAFDEADKAFFIELCEAGVKMILLTKQYLELGYFEALKLRSDRSVGRPQTLTEWLMKATIIQTLGQEFARKHYIWI